MGLRLKLPERYFLLPLLPEYHVPMETLMQSMSGIGSGRLLPTAAAVAGLLGVIIAGFAFARSRRGVHARAGAISGTVLGCISLLIGALHAANSAGSFGTGNGLAGAIAAMLLGAVAAALGMLTLARARRG